MAARPVAMRTSATADTGIRAPFLRGSMILRMEAASSRVVWGRRTVTSKRFSPSHSSEATCPAIAVSR